MNKVELLEFINCRVNGILEGYVFLEPKFLKSIEDYVDRNNWKDLKYVIKNKKAVPGMFKNIDEYYRGATLSDKDYKDLLEDKFKYTRPTSWTSDITIARKFLSDKKYKTSNKNGGHKILFKKFLSDNEIIINIFDYVMYMINSGKANDFDEIVLDSVKHEFETIVDNIKLSKKDIYKVL